MCVHGPQQAGGAALVISKEGDKAMFTTDSFAPTTAPQIPITSEPVERESALLRALRHHQPLHTGAAEERPLLEKLGLRLLVGQSPAFRSIVQQLPKLARCEANVLLLG